MKNFFAFLIGCIFLTSPNLHAQGGTLDSTFNGTGIVEMKYLNIPTAFRQSRLLQDGKILSFGYLNDTITGQAAVFKFNSDGSVDSSFADHGVYTTQNNPPFFIGLDGLVLADGKILLISKAFYANEIGLTRLLPNGAPDPAFGLNGIKDLNINPNLSSPVPVNVMPQGDGKIIILALYEDFVTHIMRTLAIRVLPNGNVDPTFGTNGIVTFLPSNNNWKLEVYGGKIQTDGKIVVAGRTGSATNDQVWYVARLMPDGTFDPSFGVNGIVTANFGNLFTEGAFEVLLLPDGKIIAAGYGQKLPGKQFAIMRFLPNGTVDNTFGLGGKAFVDFGCCHSYIYDIVRQSDGKLVVCGTTDDDDIHFRFAVARLKPNGILDQEFGEQGRLTLHFKKDSTGAIAYKALLQPDGKILLTGNTVNDATSTANSGVLVRLNPGSLVGLTAAQPMANYALQVSPNPVSGSSLQVAYTLPEATSLSITLFDALGRPVSLLLNVDWQSEGPKSETIQLPEDLPAGQYLVRLGTKHGYQLAKIIKLL